MKMVQASIVKFDDVKQSPEMRMELPLPIPIGSKLRLAFTLTRTNKGRTEELRVNGEFQVTTVITDATKGKVVQVVTVSSVGLAPSWVAIKSPPAIKLAPTHNGPTKVL
jgi:hypothetical protein